MNNVLDAIITARDITPGQETPQDTPTDTTRLLTSDVFLKFGILGQHIENAQAIYASIPTSNGQGQCHERLLELVRVCQSAILTASRLMDGNR